MSQDKANKAKEKADAALSLSTTYLSEGPTRAKQTVDVTMGSASKAMEAKRQGSFMDAAKHAATTIITPLGGVVGVPAIYLGSAVKASVAAGIAGGLNVKAEYHGRQAASQRQNEGSGNRQSSSSSRRLV